MSNSDFDQLKGILKEFNLAVAKKALDELVADKMPHSSGFKNQGEKCSHGQDCCIGREEFTTNLERVWDQNNLLSAHFLTEGAQMCGK